MGPRPDGTGAGAARHWSRPAAATPPHDTVTTTTLAPSTTTTTAIVPTTTAPPTTTTTRAERPPIAEEGDRNEIVEAIQFLLNCNGFGDLEVDGAFGPATLAAVEAAQGAWAAR